MDRGAARSRKRSQKVEKEVAAGDKPAVAGPSDRPSKAAGKGKRERNGGDRTERPAKRQREDGGTGAAGDKDGEDEKPMRRGRKPVDLGPDRFKPKAIRQAHALVYSQAAFSIPPPADKLEGVTRVDLEGSECTDVSWLPSSVTWLNLKSCPISAGWDVVGNLNLTVLNISACGLTKLPQELKALKGLKALVAMNNEWQALDDDVVASWKELNSLIVSHSPNLSSLPPSLSTLPHISKLAFSHCPALTASSLPDLTPLPVLRDVKANNLARLDSLPSHMATWGTGELSLVGKPGDKRGDGLDVLDIGNCSLSFSAVSDVFGLGNKKPKYKWHLRSLTLQANPLAVEQPKYAELLQASPACPNLQIIDSKRVKERKKAGVVSEPKADRKARERKEGKMKPSGANVTRGEMRVWGAAKEGEDAEGDDGEKEPVKERGSKWAGEKRKKADKPEKRKREEPEPEREAAPAPAPAPAKPTKASEPAPEESRKKRKRKHGKSEIAELMPNVLAVEPGKKVVAVKPKPVKEVKEKAVAVPTHQAVQDPSALRAAKAKSATAVVKVEQVKKKRDGGLDLKAALASSGTGLDVGGW